MPARDVSQGCAHHPVRQAVGHVDAEQAEGTYEGWSVRAQMAPTLNRTTANVPNNSAMSFCDVRYTGEFLGSARLTAGEPLR